MTKFQKKISTAIATAALLANTALPALAATTIEISGNGTDTSNTANVTLTQETAVVQSNSADVMNKVDVHADSGDNTATDNTGGSVDIETGDAEVDVKVDNTLNSNAAEVGCCPQGPVDVLVSGNGEDSNNTANVGLTSETELFQENEAEVKNMVSAEAETGENEAEDNTNGSVSIKTGDASVGVALSTTANANTAKVGGGAGTSSLSAKILDNGAETENKINLSMLSDIAVVQGNEADIFNMVDAEAYTGDNEAEDNTGGEVEIETGDAEIDVTVDNMANFNWADVDCGGCLLGNLLVKIADNGAETHNTANVTFGQETGVFQGNCEEVPTAEGGQCYEECEIDNFIGLEAETGENEVEDSTGHVNGDPTAETGDADVDVQVETTGNANVYDKGLIELPEVDFDFGLNFSGMFAWLIAMVS